MDNYERQRGLKTIWQTIVRRWRIILIVFIPIAIGSFIVTKFILKTSYQSSVTMLNNGNLDVTKHANIQGQIKKDETINNAIAALAELESPIAITSSEILSGLTITAFNSSNPGVVAFSYKSTNQSIVTPVLKALSESALEEIKANGYASMTISSPASSAKDISNNNKYFLIGMAAGLVLACGLSFIDEIVSDEVYDKSDIETYNLPGFEIKASK